MVCFCFLVDQTRKVRQSKPAAGICSRCGGGASVADMKDATRFCCVPFYCKTWRAIVCTFCGAILKSYRNRVVGWSEITVAAPNWCKNFAKLMIWVGDALRKRLS